jgi:hypothetical protein
MHRAGTPSRRPRGRPKALSEVAEMKLHDFLCRGDICYTLPGRNNQVYICKKNGESQYATKKYLQWTYDVLAAILSDETDPDLKSIKESTMYRFICLHKEFVGQSKIPEVSCLCPQCEGLELTLDGVNKECKTHYPTSCKDILKTLACDPITEECANGSCDICFNKTIDLKPLEKHDSIGFNEWKKIGKASYPTKEWTELSGNDTIKKLKDMFAGIVPHYYNKREQSRIYTHEVKNLEVGEALVHVDFSENYKNRQQREVKAAFYGQGQFSLYTVCMYVKEAQDQEVKCYKDVIVTEENDHSCNVAYALNQRIINNLKTQVPNLNTVKFWSDGCGSQFRSQFAFYMITRFSSDIHIEWNFFEANHGKGCVDGLGGTVKHAVWRRVVMNQVVIRSAKQFAEVADNCCPNINVSYVESAELDLGYHEECRSLAKPVQDTLRVHYVRRVITESQYQLEFYSTSSSPDIMSSVVFPRDVHYIQKNITASGKLIPIDPACIPRMKIRVMH